LADAGEPLPADRVPAPALDTNRRLRSAPGSDYGAQEDACDEGQGRRILLAPVVDGIPVGVSDTEHLGFWFVEQGVQPVREGPADRLGRQLDAAHEAAFELPPFRPPEDQCMVVVGAAFGSAEDALGPTEEEDVGQTVKLRQRCADAAAGALLEQLEHKLDLLDELGELLEGVVLVAGTEDGRAINFVHISERPRRLLQNKAPPKGADFDAPTIGGPQR
jgi:hypothetical protein